MTKFSANLPSNAKKSIGFRRWLIPLFEILLVGGLGVLKTHSLSTGLAWGFFEALLLAGSVVARRLWQKYDTYKLSQRLPQAVRGFLLRNRDVSALLGQSVGITLVAILLLVYIDAWFNDDVGRLLVTLVVMALLGTFLSILSVLSVDRGGRVVRYQEITRLLEKPGLEQAQTHYAKAIGFFLDQADTDSENCIKDSVCALEAGLQGWSGLPAAKDFDKAVKQIQQTGKIPPTLAEGMIKVYAYRGAAAGVAHGNPEGSAVSDDTAELVMNLVSSYIVFLEKIYSKDQNRPTLNVDTILAVDHAKE